MNSFGCAGQAGHFCLLARIETEETAPFGMTVPETMSVSANTTQNNNIAWKNVTIVDNVSEPLFLMISGTTIRNIFDREAFFAIRLVDRTERRRFLLQEIADVGLILPEEVLERVFADRRRLQDLETGEIEGVDGRVLLMTGKAPAFRIPMRPNEAFTAQLFVRLRDDRIPDEVLVEPFLIDIEQALDLPREMFGRDEKALDTGGVRFEFDVTRALKARGERGASPAERITTTDLDRLLQLRDLLPVDMTVDLQVDRLRQMQTATAAEREEASRHLSPGEPLEIVLGNEDARHDPGDRR